MAVVLVFVGLYWVSFAFEVMSEQMCGLQLKRNERGQSKVGKCGYLAALILYVQCAVFLCLQLHRHQTIYFDLKDYGAHKELCV